MIRLRFILICMVGICLVQIGIGWAVGDRFSEGFYTRGVDTALYLDQGSSVIDPFSIPVGELSLVPRVSLSVLHEDNVFLDPENPTPNTSVSVVPGLSGFLGRPNANHFFVDGGLIIPVYESEKELNDRPSGMLALGASWRNGKSQVQGRLGFRSLEDVDAVIGERISRQDYFTDVNAEYRISGKSSLGVLGRVERHLYDQEQYMEYDRFYGAGRIYHRATAKSEVFLQGGAGRDDPLKERFAANAADFYDLSLGARGKQSPKFNLSGRFGYMWRIYDAENREDRGHWIASLQAETTPFGLSLFSSELYADIRPSIDSTGADVIDQGAEIAWSRRMFVDRLRGNASLTGGVVDYIGDSSAEQIDAEGQAVSLDGRRDLYWGFTVGADWYTRDHFSLGMAYSFMERKGDRDGTEEAQKAASYEYARWSLRASWNY